MWRFKPSKFKNAVPKTPKSREEWITDISVGFLPSFGNHVKASSVLVAFNVDQEGQGNLGIVSLQDFGNKSRNLSVLHAHAGFVTDFDFCPYDDYILATSSEDCQVKLWRIPEECKPPPNPEIVLQLPHRVETVQFHPQVDCILSVTESSSIHLYDVNTAQSIYSNTEHSSLVQSISWKYSGEMLASCGQDKKLRIWDPRNPSNSQVAANHNSDRDSRVVWMGDSDQLITSGLGSERQREVFVRDVRNLTEPLASYSGDTSLKSYIPLYDPDTNMLFLAAQGDHTVINCEIVEYAPYLQEASKHVSEIQVFGAAMVPKRALNLMEAEVNRLLLLGKNALVPLSLQVPRKSYRSFHEDLFPDTFDSEPNLTPTEWQAGGKVQIKKVSLNPSNVASLIKSNHRLGTGKVLKASDKSITLKPSDVSVLHTDQKHQTVQESSKPLIPAKPRLSLKSEEQHNAINTEMKLKENLNVVPETTKENTKSATPHNQRSSYSFGIRQSKFRHLNGAVLPKEYHLTNLTSLTRTMPGESNGFDANSQRVAIAVGAGGNFLAILELSRPGRVPAIADMPGIVSRAGIMDFCWDPFNSTRLAVACENGFLQIWMIPKELSEKLEEPEFSLQYQSERVTIVKFHPCASDVLASASGDLSICIWDLSSQAMIYRLSGPAHQILSFAWSQDGKCIASVSKDQRVRVYDARESTEPIQEGSGPKGMRGARIVWVLNGTYLAISGFSKVSERQVYLYDMQDISNPVEDISLDVSPATLIPFYDEDSSTLFLSGKGDAIIYAYEISAESPHFHPLSHYKCPGPHQGISFLEKTACDVRKVEFAKAVRLTTSTVETVSFYVPRLRMEYFQDDLFPPTLVTNVPSMTSSEWFSGVDRPLKRVDLKPPDMTSLSEAPAPVKPEAPISETHVGIIFEGEVTLESSLAFLQNSKEKEERIVQSMMSQCKLQESNLPQEEFEGVDPSEWDEDV